MTIRMKRIPNPGSGIPGRGIPLLLLPRREETRSAGIRDTGFGIQGSGELRL